MGEVRFFSAAIRKTIAVLLLILPSVLHAQQPQKAYDLLQQFLRERDFWSQFQIGKAIVATGDKSILPRLAFWLNHDDRHIRGNTAFVVAALGEQRGFDVIIAILNDRSDMRPVHQISSTGRPWVEGQIREDRYYAAHLLGDLKDPRAVPVLVPLLKDKDIQAIVPWSLGQIGDRSAIAPLIETLNDPDPAMRVLAIHALVDLKAKEAMPRLRRMLQDKGRMNFGPMEVVGDVAKDAVKQLEGSR